MSSRLRRIKHPQQLGDRLGEPDSARASLIVLFDGWLEDLVRLHASLAQHLGPAGWELICVDNPVDDDASDVIAGLHHVVHVPVHDRVGWAAGQNLGLRRASGGLVVLIDTSVELTGDALTRLERQLRDPAVGAMGRWGVRTRNGFDFEESDGPDVDGIEGYLIACRRGLLLDVGLFDPGFRWYRNADLDFSFQVRAAGYRTIVDPMLPVVRHEHRGWSSTADRDELSRRNFARFRRHWSDRPELLVSPPPATGSPPA